MLQGEHFAILSTFIKLPFVIKIFFLSIFEWPFYTGFTVHHLWSVKGVQLRVKYKIWNLCNFTQVPYGKIIFLKTDTVRTNKMKF